jgi:hypothetical protein
MSQLAVVRCLSGVRQIALRYCTVSAWLGYVEAYVWDPAAWDKLRHFQVQVGDFVLQCDLDELFQVSSSVIRSEDSAVVLMALS